MTLEEAIKILEHYPPGASPDSSIKFNGAILLLIEAGKELQHLRGIGAFVYRKSLPGETT